MKKYIIISTLSLLMGCATNSHSDYWVPHWNKEGTLFGYKTEKGEVKIQPKYVDFAYVSRFDDFTSRFEHIVAVAENEGDEYRSYYLTKSGDTFGNDSIYIEDSGSVDCENEGCIRFTDKNGLVGLFDLTGKIVIPCIYDELSKVHNGLLWARKGADKVYDEDDPERFHFINGEHLLLNTKGDLLIRNFSSNNYYPLYGIDLYSMETSNEKKLDSTKLSFLGENGMYYTFSDFRLTFEEWLETDLINNLTRNYFEEIIADSINCRGYFLNSNYLESTNTRKSFFLDKYFEMIRSKFLEISESNVHWFSKKHQLNPLTYSRMVYSQYFDNCGYSKDNQYPVIQLVVNRDNERQDIYSFLKTEDNKYKLIGLRIDRK